MSYVDGGGRIRGRRTVGAQRSAPDDDRKGILLMEKLGQLLRTTWKRLLTLRMVAWSPVLVAAIIIWWVVKWWFSRRRARSDERTVRGTGGATRDSLQSGGR